MNVLKTARVVVIDDDRDEALPIIESLGRLGIGCIWVSGADHEKLPPEPIVGARLVFLDMDLDTGGDHKTWISTTLGVLEATVGNPPPPVLLVLWTKHVELEEEFEQAFHRGMPDAGFVKITRMDKPIRLEGNAEDTEALTAEMVLPRISEILKEASPLDALWGWEQLVHDAATDTTEAVAKSVQVVAPGALKGDKDYWKHWLDGLSQVLHLLGKCSAGQALTENSVTQDVLESVNAILRDRIEARTFAAGIADLRGILEADARALSSERHAVINTMFVSATPREDGSSLIPGDVIILPSDRTGECRLLSIGLDFEELVKHCRPQLDKDDAVRAISAKINGLKKGDPKKGELEKVREQAKEIVKTRFESIVVEVSPTCDYVQKKCPVAKLIAGLLVFGDDVKLFDESKNPSIRMIEQLKIRAYQDRIAHLVLNARFTFGLAAPENGVLLKSVIRLRSETLNDLRVWLVGQGARPGYLKLESLEP